MIGAAAAGNAGLDLLAIADIVKKMFTAARPDSA